MKNLIQSLPVVLGVALALSLNSGTVRAAKTRDVCIVNPPEGGTLNTFVFRDVEPLSVGGAISVHGLFFTAARKVAPFHGSAVMVSDGTVRLGLFVHSSAQAANDFTISGVTDANFVGTLSFDNDGDFVPNGTLAMASADCSAIAIP